MNFQRLAGMLFCFGFYSIAGAGELAVPNEFSAGSPAVAEQVNANFSATKTAVDDNNARVVSLEEENADLKTRLEALESFIADLQTHMDVTTDVQGNPAIIFSGVNVHVNNGHGRTDIANGLGNLIIGYDERRDSTKSDPVCSVGQYVTQAGCETNGAEWGVDHKSGSHNLVVGSQHNYSRHSGLVAGHKNTINAGSASVAGGFNNIASAIYAAVTGGRYNTASGHGAAIIGGAENTASGLTASISGGDSNVASGNHASISGGQYNTASGSIANVSGGRSNTASGPDASVSGGQNNEASGSQATVGGGIECEASSTNEWVAGC